MISLEEVTKIYHDGKKAVDKLCLKIKEGECTILIGPSGCGKTTTLKMINRLIEPTSGTIMINGKDIAQINQTELRRGIGYCIQEIGLFPHMTVGANVGIVPSLLKWDKKDVEERVYELLELVKLNPAEFYDKYPAELSGGQRQRVGVARSLGADPPILLMDEPFGALDPITRMDLQYEFIDILGKVKKTVVFVTHDMEEAMRLGDRIAIMREGKLVQYDTPLNIIKKPRDKFVENFIGKERAKMFMDWFEREKRE